MIKNRQQRAKHQKGLRIENGSHKQNHHLATKQTPQENEIRSMKYNRVNGIKYLKS
jgi:hypothetical protein